MKKLVVTVLACLALAACTGQKIKQTEPVYQSTFPTVPLEERVGGEWMGGPASPPK